MIQTIDGALMKQMLINGAASVELHKQQINELNVFPVPDGDTGTNMSMTLSAAANELRKSEGGALSDVVQAAASAMLRGARGNSGVITSLLFRGIAKYMKGKDTVDCAGLAGALTEGVEAAYKAVMKPAEGTILTVSRVTAEQASTENAPKDDLDAMLQFMIEQAKIALAETVNQNPVLKKAGVVDAGGIGFVYLLEGMLSALRGEMIELGEEAVTETKGQADFTEFATEDIVFAYCTEFIVSRENDKSPELLRSFLTGIGDSLVLVDDDEIIKVHVHTNNPGKVIEEAITYGGLVTVKIENMKLQHTEKVMSAAEVAEAAPSQPAIAPAEKEIGVVSVCVGEGLEALFHDLGVDGLIQGGQTMNPSTDDILRQINQTPANTVLVLPNNSNIIMAAQQAGPLTEKNVVVIPTKSVPEGVAAMLSFDPESDVAALIETMTAAAQNVETLQITYAARDSDFDGAQIREGDYIAFSGKKLLGDETDEAALLAKVAAYAGAQGKEFVTIYYGEGVEESRAEAALSAFSSACPDCEVTLVNGGQPVYYYLISLE
jgi:hypothetical protein